MDVGDGDAFVGFVHRGVDEAKFRDRAKILDEARIGGAAAGGKFGRPARSRCVTALTIRSVNAPGSVTNATPLTLGSNTISQPVCPATDFTSPSRNCSKRLGRVTVVEADVERRARLGRNHIGCGIADIDAGEGQRRRLEMRRAVVELMLRQPRHQIRERRDRIAGLGG